MNLFGFLLQVDVKLPVVTIKEEYDLRDALTDMGMGSMFSRGKLLFLF